jgi:hypothetical protein
MSTMQPNLMSAIFHLHPLPCKRLQNLGKLSSIYPCLPVPGTIHLSHSRCSVNPCAHPLCDCRLFTADQSVTCCSGNRPPAAAGSSLLPCSESFSLSARNRTNELWSQYMKGLQPNDVRNTKASVTATGKHIARLPRPRFAEQWKEQRAREADARNPRTARRNNGPYVRLACACA